MTITKTVLGAVVLALLVTLPAQAQLPQTLDEMKAHMDAVASHLGLDLGMSKTELAAFWPQKVEKSADLSPVVATVNNPDRLNNLLGGGSAFERGDFAALSPFSSERGAGNVVSFVVMKEYDKSSPKLAEAVCTSRDADAAEFYGAVEKAGLRSSGKPGNFVPDFLLATIIDPVAFNAAFSGKGTAVRGQLVVLKPGDKGTAAFLTSGMSPERRYVVSDGKVSEIK